MEKVIGGILGLAAFVAVVAAGMLRGLGVLDTLWRAVVAGIVGYLLGWTLLGRIGVDLAKQAAAQTIKPEGSESAPAPATPAKPPTTPPAAPK